MGKKASLQQFPVMPPRLAHPDALAVVDFAVNGVVVCLHLASRCLPCAYTVALPVEAVCANTRRYNGFTELRFCVDVRQRSARCRGLFLALRLPWGTVHYLGPLTHNAPVSSGRFVREVPSAVTLVVDVDWCAPVEVGAPLPCEMLLKEHVRTVIENDEFCGSIAAAHVQNLVRDLPFYDAAMQRFRNWSEYVTFFAECYRCWKVVQYEPEEHAARGLSSRTPAGEQRMVANCYAGDYARADAHRDRVKRRALQEFRDCLAARGVELSWSPGKDGKVEPSFNLSRKLLLRLGCERSFRTLNSVNYLHVLEELRASHMVLFSELHPVQVDEAVSTDTSLDLLLRRTPAAKQPLSPMQA
ncbi:hypothetical protein LPMP_260110 [Leishmania panamensis]|uniref:Uncharacterized protein n=7 Tax=Viannia TaxID=37616 RepID=A4HEL6_LEIBR|nr:conserved hypothetical protein [Leishmania braziliensis MHOM/BR/75/M2904]XP_010699833.1 hypothetical protein LPMP_260110 [Leishmania panamensis]KAI5685406.1 hypothetical protein MNV84_04599 [Leishmania braziliensis]CCM16303.1 hypothetical protein, conserved [Leishmania guyanensis]AIN99126.1 hypothetical protein LPMP_260110 [Leishmania panamensis]CAJ2474480.1 unnamed protein product [Leishmania braziliensis]CAJ2474996.1 unnamed protein product [Leishmania braziliensis]